MNSPEAQYQLAKKMPTASLANILRGIPGAIDQGIAMMVLGERQRMKTASQGQQAGAEAQQPSVKDRMLLAQQGQLPEHQGIGTLPSPNMGQVAAMAQGGVVGFAGGGDVQHFQVGGASYVEGPPSYLTTPEEIAEYEKFRAEQRRLIMERQARVPQYTNTPSTVPKQTYPVNNPRVAPPPPAMLDPMNPGVTNSPLAKVGNAPAAASSSYTQVSGTPMGEVPPPQRGRISAKMGAGNVARGRGYGLAGVGASIFDAAYLANPGLFQDYLASDETKKREAQGTAQIDYNSFPSQQLSGPTTDIAAAPVKGIGRPRGEAAPSGGKGLGDLKLLPTQPALPMMGFDDSVATTGTAAQPAAAQPAAAQPAAAKPATADSAEDIKALAPVSSFAATQGIMNASTKPYMDEMTETFKSFSLTPDEKSDQKFTRLGTVALSAAKELLASGRPGMSSVGAALGQVGTMAQQYAKEDREDKRALLGAKMSMLGAQVQVAQGNTKSAIEFFNNAEQMAFKGIELRTNTKIKNEELRLKELGIFNEKDFHNKTIQYHNAQIEEQREWHTAHIPVLRAQAGLAGAQAGYWGAAGAQNKLMLNAIGQFRKSDENLAKGVGADAKAARARLSGDGSVYAEMARRQLGFETLGLGALEPKSSIQKDTIDPADVFKVN